MLTWNLEKTFVCGVIQTEPSLYFSMFSKKILNTLPAEGRGELELNTEDKQDEMMAV